MAMSVDKHAPIAIVGAGCWGLSTAYHLVKDGYDNVTVFDRASAIPSPYSAADDLNKIIRAQYDDDFWTDLGVVSSISLAPVRIVQTLDVLQSADSRISAP